MLHLLSLKYLLKTNICIVQIKAAETDNKHFAQHPKFGDKTQTQICPHLPLPFHELDFTFLVPSFNSYRKHTSLDLRGPPVPRTKLGIGPREDGRSFLHPNIINPKPYREGKLLFIEHSLCIERIACKASFYAHCSLDGKHCGSPHFTAGKAETEGGEVPFPRTHT